MANSISTIMSAMYANPAQPAVATGIIPQNKVDANPQESQFAQLLASISYGYAGKARQSTTQTGNIAFANVLATESTVQMSEPGGVEWDWTAALREIISFLKANGESSAFTNIQTGIPTELVSRSELSLPESEIKLNELLSTLFALITASESDDSSDASQSMPDNKVPELFASLKLEMTKLSMTKLEVTYSDGSSGSMSATDALRLIANAIDLSKEDGLSEAVDNATNAIKLFDELKGQVETIGGIDLESIADALKDESETDSALPSLLNAIADLIDKSNMAIDEGMNASETNSTSHAVTSISYEQLEILNWKLSMRGNDAKQLATLVGRLAELLQMGEVNNARTSITTGRSNEEGIAALIKFLNTLTTALESDSANASNGITAADTTDGNLGAELLSKYLNGGYKTLDGQTGTNSPSSTVSGEELISKYLNGGDKSLTGSKNGSPAPNVFGTNGTQAGESVKAAGSTQPSSAVTIGTLQGDVSLTAQSDKIDSSGNQTYLLKMASSNGSTMNARIVIPTGSLTPTTQQTQITSTSSTGNITETASNGLKPTVITMQPPQASEAINLLENVSTDTVDRLILDAKPVSRIQELQVKATHETSNTAANESKAPVQFSLPTESDFRIKAVPERSASTIATETFRIVQLSEIDSGSTDIFSGSKNNRGLGASFDQTATLLDNVRFKGETFEDKQFDVTFAAARQEIEQISFSGVQPKTANLTHVTRSDANEVYRAIVEQATEMRRLNETARSIRIEVDPPHLGPLSARLEINGSTLSLTIAVNSSSVREHFEQQLNDLKNTLAAQGFEQSMITVEVDSGSGRGYSSDASTNSDGGSGSQSVASTCESKDVEVVKPRERTGLYI